MGHLRVEVPAPNDDKVLHPAADEDVSRGVHPSKVSRTEKRWPVIQKRATMSRREQSGGQNLGNRVGKS